MCAGHMGNTLQELASNIIVYNVSIMYIMPVQGLTSNVILYNVNIMYIMRAVGTKLLPSHPTL